MVLAISARSYLGASLFLVALVILGLVVLVGLLWWQRRVNAADHDETQTVLRNTSIPFMLQLLTRGIDLGFVMVLYRFISPDAVGGFEFAAIVVVQYLGTLADWGLTTLAMREISVAKDRSEILFRTTLRLRLRLALLAIPLALLFVVLYQGLYSLNIIRQPLGSSIVLMLGILVLTLLPSAWSGTVTALLQAHERHEVAAVVNLLTNIFSGILRTSLLMLGFGIIGVASGALLASVIGAGLFVFALKRVWGALPIRGPLTAMRPLLSEGWPLMLNALLIGVFFRFDTLIIQAVQGAAALATYNTAYKYVNLTQIIPPVVVNAVFPMLTRRAQNDREGMLRAYAGTLRMLMLLAFPIAMGMTVLATPLMLILADTDYLPGSAYALMCTIWYLPGSYINGLTQYVVIALGKQRMITKAFGWTALFNLALNILLIPMFGYLIAAAVTIASEAVLFLLLRKILRTESVMPAVGLLVLRPALAALGMGLVMWGALQLHVVLAFVIALPVYVGILVLLKTFNQTDRQILQRLLKRG